jgi:hypothetical protein
MVNSPYNSGWVTWHVGPQAKISSWGPGDAARWCGHLGTRVFPWLEPGRLLWGLTCWPAFMVSMFPPAWGDAEGLCYQHRPLGCSRQVREHGLLTGVVPSHRTVEACVALYRLFGWDARPQKGSSSRCWLSGSSCQVPVARRVWEPMVMSCLVLHYMTTLS